MATNGFFKVENCKECMLKFKPDVNKCKLCMKHAGMELSTEQVIAFRNSLTEPEQKNGPESGEEISAAGCLVPLFGLVNSLAVLVLCICLLIHLFSGGSLSEFINGLLHVRL